MSEPVLHIDFETRSAVDLKRAGAYRYAEDPTTEIICLSYRIGDGPVQRWRPGEALPVDLTSHLMLRGQSLAHNASFERLIWNNKVPAEVDLRPWNQACTMARAAALALPTSLDQLGEALKTRIQKDKVGHRLMLKMCKPKSIQEIMDPVHKAVSLVGKTGTPEGQALTISLAQRARRVIEWHEDPADIARLQAYCDQDVLTECEIDKILPPLSPEEQKLWVLDQTINDRGVAVDTILCRRALDAVEEAKRRADDRIWRLTEGAVRRCSETAKIVAWINARGVPCTSVAQDETDELILSAGLFDDIVVEEVVRLRQASAKTFKFKSMLDQACADGRVRGSLAYHGTLNGRWAGRGIQPQNFKRIETEDDAEIVVNTVAALERARTAVETVDMLDLYGPPMEALSLCARAMIVAPKGKKLIGGDFSNIEGRVNAWLAGEEWKLQAFRDYDAGRGPDLYKVMASAILDKPVEAVQKEDRQIWGKVPELACGYQGGVGAFHKMGANYGVRIEDAQARRIVRGWRDNNPCIVELWGELQNAAIEAVDQPGLVVPVAGGRVRYRCANGFLFCQLPSGRVIAYSSPTVERKEKVVVIDGEEVTFNNWGVSFWGVKKGWRKLDLYGGMQCAHVVSGTARDILVGSMFRLEAAGYPIVLTIHDENLSEVDEGFGSVAEYEQIMSEPMAFSRDIPIVAKAWEDTRYQK